MVVRLGRLSRLCARLSSVSNFLSILLAPALPFFAAIVLARYGSQYASCRSGRSLNRCYAASPCYRRWLQQQRLPFAAGGRFHSPPVSFCTRLWAHNRACVVRKGCAWPFEWFFFRAVCGSELHPSWDLDVSGCASRCCGSSRAALGHERYHSWYSGVSCWASQCCGSYRAVWRRFREPLQQPALIRQCSCHQGSALESWVCEWYELPCFWRSKARDEVTVAACPSLGGGRRQ